MHELQACEIPVLWCFCLAIWSAATAACSMPTYVDNPPAEAWSSYASDAEIRPLQGPRGWPLSRAAILKAPWGGVAGISVSFPPGTSSLCRSAQSSGDPQGASRAPGRWLVVRVRWSAVGSLFDGTQTLQWQCRDLSRPAVAAGKGGSVTLAASLGDDPAGRRASYPSHGGRQPPWNAAHRQPAPVGVAALPIPFAPETAGAASWRTLRASRWTRSRGDPPTHPQRLGVT